MIDKDGLAKARAKLRETMRATKGMMSDESYDALLISAYLSHMEAKRKTPEEVAFEVAAKIHTEWEFEGQHDLEEMMLIVTAAIKADRVGR